MDGFIVITVLGVVFLLLVAMAIREARAGRPKVDRSARRSLRRGSGAAGGVSPWGLDDSGSTGGHHHYGGDGGGCGSGGGGGGGGGGGD